MRMDHKIIYVCVTFIIFKLSNILKNRKMAQTMIFLKKLINYEINFLYFIYLNYYFLFGNKYLKTISGYQEIEALRILSDIK